MKGRRRKRTKKPVHLDSDLLAEIYDTYQRPIYAAIFRQVSDVETARDLTADVFHRLLQAVQKGKGPTQNVRAWLYRTAHNIVVDHYRRRQFRDHDQIQADPPARELDPAQAAENLLAVDSVRKAFLCLTIEQRQVINLRFWEGLSLVEVAYVMNKTTGAVKSLQHRALKKVQDEIKRQEIVPALDLEPAKKIERDKEKGMESPESIPSTCRPLLNTSSQ